MTLARSAGVLYLILTITALFAEIGVRSRIFVKGDALASVHNIQANEFLYRAGFIADLVTVVCDIGVAVLLYLLFLPVSRPLSMLAAAFRIGMACLLAFAAILSMGPLLLATGGSGQSFSPAASQLFLIISGLRGIGANSAMVLFGVHLTLLGYLVVRSGFLPKLIGMLLTAAGVGYILNSCARFLWPGFIDPAFPVIAALWAAAEWSFTAWLLVKGVNVERWRMAATP
jgi:hypothetical protein